MGSLISEIKNTWVPIKKKKKHFSTRLDYLSVQQKIIFNVFFFFLIPNNPSSSIYYKLSSVEYRIGNSRGKWITLSRITCYRRFLIYDKSSWSSCWDPNGFDLLTRDVLIFRRLQAADSSAARWTNYKAYIFYEALIIKFFFSGEIEDGTYWEVLKHYGTVAWKKR